MCAGARDTDSIRRRVRLVVLLDASREAGLDPLPALRLHLISYLTNVLSPVWDMGTAQNGSLGNDGSILKNEIGPFYPDLQQELDRLVGMGVVKVEKLRYRPIGAGRTLLDGRYRINSEVAEPILTHLSSIASEAHTARYVRELVFALSALSDEELDRAASEDATYGDPTVSVDNVVDFGEWLSTNYSVASAKTMGALVTTGVGVGASEKVHLYIRHLRRRLQGAK